MHTNPTTTARAAPYTAQARRKPRSAEVIPKAPIAPFPSGVPSLSWILKSSSAQRYAKTAARGPAWETIGPLEKGHPEREDGAGQQGRRVPGRQIILHPDVPQLRDPE